MPHRPSDQQREPLGVRLTARRRRAWWRARRAVLARRRWLAALLAAAAVLAGLRAVAPPPEPDVAVRVAARDLPAGTVLVAADLTAVHLPRGSPPDGLADAPVGRTLAAPLRRGEAVTDVRLVGPGLTAAQSGVDAVPVRIPDAGMVSLLAVGDRIDLLATDPQTGLASTLASDALVLALPVGEPETGAAGLTGRLVVVGVPPGEVADLSAASVTMFLTVAFSR